MLAGIMLSRNGDGDRVRDLLRPEMMISDVVSKCVTAVRDKDRGGVAEYLAKRGVQFIDDESAVDAILRTFLFARKREVEKLLKEKSALERRLREINEGIKKEVERDVKSLEKGKA